MAAVTFAQQVLDALPESPVGRRAAWVWRQTLAMAAGAPVPGENELEEQYSRQWLHEVPMEESLARMASLAGNMRDVRGEPASANEVRLVIGLADGQSRRFRCVVQPVPPHRIV